MIDEYSDGARRREVRWIACSADGINAGRVPERVGSSGEAEPVGDRWEFVEGMREQIPRERGDRPLADFADPIHEMQEEHDHRLMEAIGVSFDPSKASRSSSCWAMNSGQ